MLRMYSSVTLRRHAGMAAQGAAAWGDQGSSAPSGVSNSGALLSKHLREYTWCDGPSRKMRRLRGGGHMAGGGEGEDEGGKCGEGAAEGWRAGKCRWGAEAGWGQDTSH